MIMMMIYKIINWCNYWWEIVSFLIAGVVQSVEELGREKNVIPNYQSKVSIVKAIFCKLCVYVVFFFSGQKWTDYLLTQVMLYAAFYSNISHILANAWVAALKNSVIPDFRNEYFQLTLRFFKNKKIVKHSQQRYPSLLMLNAVTSKTKREVTEGWTVS